MSWKSKTNGVPWRPERSSGRARGKVGCGRSGSVGAAHTRPRTGCPFPGELTWLAACLRSTQASGCRLVSGGPRGGLQGSLQRPVPQLQLPSPFSTEPGTRNSTVSHLPRSPTARLLRGHSPCVSTAAPPWAASHPAGRCDLGRSQRALQPRAGGHFRVRATPVTEGLSQTLDPERKHFAPGSSFWKLLSPRETEPHPERSAW